MDVPIFPETTRIRSNIYSKLHVLIVLKYAILMKLLGKKNTTMQNHCLTFNQHKHLFLF